MGLQQSALALELGLRPVYTDLSNEKVKVRGLGPAFVLRRPLLREPLARLVRLQAQGEFQLLAGMGATFGAVGGVGVALQRSDWSWQPEINLLGRVLAGSMVRAVDEEGKVAGNPISVEIDFAPLVFRADGRSLSLLPLRYGTTPLDHGKNARTFTIGLFEIGMQLQKPAARAIESADTSQDAVHEPQNEPKNEQKIEKKSEPKEEGPVDSRDF